MTMVEDIKTAVLYFSAYFNIIVKSIIKNVIILAAFKIYVKLAVLCLIFKPITIPINKLFVRPS